MTPTIWILLALLMLGIAIEFGYYLGRRAAAAQLAAAFKKMPLRYDIREAIVEAMRTQ